jgi:GT2 family glycosyltransferase
MSLISLITVNYNGLSDTCKLIESVYSAFGKGGVIVGSESFKIEIIVVDNNKESSDLKVIAATYPDVVAVQNPSNSGFAAGNNLGLKYAHGDYILFINNDVEFRDDSLKFLLERVSSFPEVAGASPKILSSHDGKTIQYAGYTPLTKITMRNRTIGLNEVDKGEYDDAHQVPYIHGAAFLIKKEVVDSVGGWPECYFLYYEELDWSVQIRRMGYELWYEPACTVYHSGSASIGVNSPVQVFYMTRNRMIFAKRNFTKLNALLSILYQKCIAVPKQCFKFAMRGRFSLISTSIKACCHLNRDGKVDFNL